MKDLAELKKKMKITHNSVWEYQFNVTMVTNCVLIVQFKYLYYCNFVEIHCIHYYLKMWTVVHKRYC